jgi:hypothetical protein
MFFIPTLGYSHPSLWSNRGSARPSILHTTTWQSTKRARKKENRKTGKKKERINQQEKRIKHFDASSVCTAFLLDFTQDNHSTSTAMVHSHRDQQVENNNLFML